jgi:outer membrane protein assembly factor BamD (BamD/ComL family)
MLKHKKIFINLLILMIFASIAVSQENTWQLNEKQNWDLIANENQKQFLTELSEVQKIVNKGKNKQAAAKFAAIKENYTEFSRKDLDLFIKSELLLAKHKLTKAARSYDKLLKNYPDSLLHEMAIKRENEIGMTFLNGKKRIALGFIPISGTEEGISILEKMTDHAGIDSQIGIDASLAIVKNYEKRKKYNEAYLKWWEIYSTGKKDNILMRDALLGMAKSKQAIYNKNPENKKAFYDASCLRTSKTYYEMLRTNYPEYAKEIGVNEIINTISEQLAYKELSTGIYYQKLGKKQSANLYFDMVINKWQNTKSAEIAQNMLNKNQGS